jgi:succinate dehydrogenase / fumarate reductase flavoprotein subunit
VPGTDKGFNQELEKAARVADFLELGELFAKHCIVMSLVAVTSVKNTKRQMEKQRDDENFAYVAALEYKGNQVMLFYIKRHWFSIMLNW